MKKLIILTTLFLITGVVSAETILDVTANQQQQQQSNSDAMANVGDTTAMVGDTTSNVGDTTAMVGDTSNNGNTQQIVFQAAQTERTRGAENANYEFTDNRNTIRYEGEYSIKNTPNVSAPALTTTMSETCMGSSSMGGSVPGFGLSFGTTWRDSACVRRLDARQLQSLGYNLGAKELMCDSEAVRQALKRAGKPCYVDLPSEAKRPEDRVEKVEEKNEPFVLLPVSG